MNSQALADEELLPYLGAPQPCLICGQDEKHPWGRRGIYTAVVCQGCGFIWIDPMPTQEGLNRYYANYIQHRLEDTVKLRQRDRQYELDRDALLEHLPGGRILDVGCNGGFFLSKFDARFEKFGIEVDAEAVQYAREHVPFGRNIRQAWIGEEGFEPGSFDAVLMRGVIEHLRDPKAGVARVAELLRPGGLLFISATPNVESFCADLYRGQWNQFTPPQHLYYFSVRTLRQLMKPLRLSLVAKDYPYLETPYANVQEDHQKVLRAYEAVVVRGQSVDELEQSPAFWGTMLTAIWRKEPSR